MSKTALLAVKSGLRYGEVQMREFLSFVRQAESELLAVSSIYAGLSNEEDLSGQWMSLAVSIKTQLSAEALFADILAVERAAEKEAPRNSPSLYLLCYEGDVEMSQKINLPHPSLHKKPELLIPAAEILGSYEHPVLNKTLSALAKSYDDQPWGRFLQQGKVLLDSQN